MIKQVVICAIVLTSLILFAAGVPPGPVACWELNEGQGVTIRDTGAAAALPGTIINSSNTEWCEGRTGGKALFFKGDPERAHKGGAVRIPLKDSFDVTRPFTLCCWIRPENLKKMPRPQQYEILSTARKNKGSGIRLLLSWNEAAFIMGSRVLRAKSSGFPIPREEWSHLAVTFDGSRIRLYVNGVLAASAQDGDESMPTRGTDYLSIGSYKAGYAYSFLGCISNVKLFDRALTDIEVLTEARELELED